jgi:hypothetical protein
VSTVSDRRLYDGIADPLFILATPRSFSSLICTMLGQHPQLHGLPETHLFGSETLDGWWQWSSGATFQLSHGLLRAVAEICFGVQTERTVAAAAAWLRRRRGHTSGFVFEELSRALAPAALIDKSPSMVYDVESMRRVLRFFPQARFIHLVRHPRGYCASVLKYRRTLARPEYQPPAAAAQAAEPPEWIEELATGEHGDIDPQGGWCTLNRNVAAFLEAVPRGQWRVVRGEDVLRNPDRQLAALAAWLGVRADPGAVERMKHPERSPYARFGPRGARLGNDILFLERPAMRPGRAEPLSLDGPLEWRSDGEGFLPEVVELGRRFGYG